MSELLKENHPQIAQISADSGINLRESAKSADRILRERLSDVVKDEDLSKFIL